MNVIQVGMGGMGNAWLRAVQHSANVDFAGFVEINDDIGAMQAEKYGLDRALIFRTLDDALAHVAADGVINVTPPQFHRDVSVQALRAGLPVLSEKPLADTPDAAHAIVQAADETGVLHMVAQNYRYNTATQTLKRTLAAGELGEIGAMAVEFFRGPHFGGFREEMAYPLIIDMSIHHFDLMRFFLERDPVTVFGRSWNPPWSWFAGDASAAVTLGFAGGVTVSYIGSWCSQARETSWNANWRVECSRGVVSLVDNQVYTQLTGQEPALVEPVTLERDGQSYLLEEFYRAVTTGTAPATTCQDNIKSLEIVFSTVRSFETGQVIAFSA